MTFVYGIGMFCTVGGRHRCTLFCVEGEGFHTHLATLVPVAHCAGLFCWVLLLSRAAGVSLSNELSSVKRSSAFGLVVFKVSFCGILFSASWLMLLHTVHLLVGHFCRVLLLSGMIRTSSSDELGSAEESSASSLAASGVLSSRVGPGVIGILPSADWFSLSVSFLNNRIGP